jgi:aspartate oxidase
LISLSIIIFVAAMLLEGLLFLSIIGSSLKAQIETFTAYIFTASIVILAVGGITSVFKRKF